ncbi:MAG: radical SAM protein [Oscillospiraceae bacterium]|nr:radical SAM protein [Oscillospiraceae bacterium]
MSTNLDIQYNRQTHRLCSKANDLCQLSGSLDRPLSVILQITRNCHFNCEFCSEKELMPDPTLDELKIYAQHLRGVPRVFLSGGEPLTRKDFREIVEIFSGNHIIGLPTNAVASDENIEIIKRNNISVNIGLDGPRAITSRVRGDYDFIMAGIRSFIKNDIDFSLTAVVLRSTVDSVLYTCQIADALGAKKMKFVLPVPKGNALQLDKNEFLTDEEATELCGRIAEEKHKYGWKTTYTFTIWNQFTNGYSILVYPNGKTYAWPALDEKDKVLLLGDLHIDSIKEIWNRFPFKHNHVQKYLGHGIEVG